MSDVIGRKFVKKSLSLHKQVLESMEHQISCDRERLEKLRVYLMQDEQRARNLKRQIERAEREKRDGFDESRFIG